ncbi:MAG TPA: transcription-repair coupling factor [Bacteroidia bacterium]|nr:transcription-repair coupling factor [Bacteroidia bacterium]
MTSDILLSFERNEKIDFLQKTLRESPACCINPEKLSGSALAFIASGTISSLKGNHLFILPETEESIYFCNDLENLLPGRDILYYPAITPAERAKDAGRSGLLKKTEILNIIRKSKGQIIVAPAAALCEKVADSKVMEENTFVIDKGAALSMDFVVELLAQYNFLRTDFVTDPGQYSRRGGILDVFSFSNEHPFRLEFYGDEVESIRLFDASTQLSLRDLKKIEITPNLRDELNAKSSQSFLEYLKESDQTYLWIKDYPIALNALEQAYEEQLEDAPESADQLFSSAAFDEACISFSRVVWGIAPASVTHNFAFPCSPQKSFGKNFNLFFDEILENVKKGYRNYIFTDTEQQVQRLKEIFSDAQLRSEYDFDLEKVLTPVFLPIYQGFASHELKLAVYTDHEIFGRYHRFRLKDTFYKSKEALTLKELQDLKPGDFVTHIDHGVGRFAGLDKVEANGNMQEVVRIIYKDNDLLLVSIHSLHRISRYSSKEGHQPTLDKLGSAQWKALKQKTKRRIKELAFDLVKIYAERKSREGFAFHPDTYLQNELEASFIYEDTPDQVKSTKDVKKDMESPHPMDRLVCGDVGFGKTEIAIRAAFKAVSDSKQVAVLVPTTILALQHFKTFSERLKEFPCNIDYLNRFRTSKARTQVLKNLEAGKLDIVIGTHQLVNKEIKFKDLGLLIVDEEQKFGVGVKEKLKTMRSTVDILTLTATPIPRTLQFSLIGIRDLSVINTPPPNRYPVQTEVSTFSDNVFRDPINYEIARGGQVFVIHNRVHDIQDIALLIKRLCPKVRIGIAHGQLKGHELEEVMMQFIEGQLDVLVSTAIVESGLDIPNLNTIIIHDAHMFGLSDLHQLRGRVGRSNKKAFCYLVVPSFETLTRDARTRLDAIEQFSDLGSGFSIAMRDLDIRGAGDLLGGEQSGFVNDMGIDTYHKILNEAIEELKEEIGGEALSSMGIQTETTTTKKFVKDCHVETDAEALIPDDYVQSSEERLRLYRELNEAKDENEMTHFEEELVDRFGKLPASVQELANVIRLRLIAAELGIERIVFKNKAFHSFFVSQADSPFYTSSAFTNMVEYIKKHPSTCKMNQARDKLSLAIYPVKTVSDALKILREMKQ